MRADSSSTRVVVVATGAGLPERLAQGVQVLTDEERRRAAAFVNRADADAYLAAHVLIRWLVEDHTGVPASRVELTRASCTWCGRPGRGAPWARGAPDVYLSWTHTPGLVAVALGLCPVGLDVEGLAPSGSLDTVIAQFHPSEQAQLEAVPSAERVRAVMRCWVRKEAVLKGIGVGIGHGVRWPVVLGAGSDDASSQVDGGWRIDDLPVPSGFVGAIAFGEATTPVRSGGAPR